MDPNSQPDGVLSTTTTITTTITATTTKPNSNTNNNIKKEDKITTTSENENDESDCSSSSSSSFYKPPEPSYTRANSLQFHTLVKRFDVVWAQRKRSSSSNQNLKRASKEDLLAHLLPKKLLTYLRGGSPFPVLRLMMPDKDNVRPHSGMKEKMIASVWGDAIGLNKNSPDFLKLTNYNDPIYAGPTACGDLSLAIFEVIDKRHPSSRNRSGSKVTVGEINSLLDELAAIKRSGMTTTKMIPASSSSYNNYRTKRQMRARWVEKLIHKNISPLEHKWIVRILLQRLEMGIGSESMLSYYHPWATDLYSANKNIRTLCATLCDSEFVRRKKEQLRREIDVVENHNRIHHLPQSHEPATLNSTIAPMLSMRTSFQSFLTDVQKRHRAYVDALDANDPLRRSLALMFPSFVSEVKLDGERILAHVKRGVVKLQTRNSVWYSNLYSPVLGPPLRRAIAKYDIDVILDGEVIAWDNVRKETIPFGANRAVAKCRREWCQRHGEIDDKDLRTHENDGDEGLNVLSTAESAMFETSRSTSGSGADDGRDCWLKFVVFDILYVGGPDASKAREEACGFFHHNSTASTTNSTTSIPTPTQSSSGSILNYPLCARKCILHTILKPQENMIEIVESNVIRSDGTCIDGVDYFTPRHSLEFGYHPAVLDSIACTLDSKLISNIELIDSKRRGRQTDRDIERLRAQNLDSFHAEIVIRRCLEGLVLKDLATPYGLGNRFRTKGYWFKLKDDYDRSGNAADIDVLVLGASFATGMRKAKLLNRFLVGCREDSTDDEFLTLCTVSGGGTSQENLERLLRSTGFKVGGNSTAGVEGGDDVGSWFKGDGTKLPDFISKSSYQRSMSSDKNGWKFKKDHYPDLWINPQDSFVLTINAGEIVSSVDHSAGVSLRFPRIARIRAKNFDDPKSASEVETVSEIHERYFQKQSQQQTAEREALLSLNSASSSQQTHTTTTGLLTTCKFLTSEQHSRKVSIAKKRKSRRNDQVRAPNILSSSKIESKILSKYTFTVLEGTYNLDSYNPDGQQHARNEGWFKDAKTVDCQQDIIDFILRHGGICELICNSGTNFIVGGRINDARVANHRRAIIAATTSDALLNAKTSKKREHLRKVADIGVIKWTFLFQTIHRIFIEASREELSLRESNPITLRPRRHDFLVLSKVAVESFLEIENTQETTLMDLKFELGTVGEIEFEVKKCNEISTDKVKKLRRLPLQDYGAWQYRGFTDLEKNEQWVLEGPRQHFWYPNTIVGEGKHAAIILYPDLFNDGDFGHKNSKDVSKEIYEETASIRWDTIPIGCVTGDIASVMPLAEAMGAHVTPHLYGDVTHILCEMKDNIILPWSTHISKAAFTDIDRGTALQSRLLLLHLQNITFVSPAWIRQHWYKQKLQSMKY